MYNFLLLTMWM